MFTAVTVGQRFFINKIGWENKKTLKTCIFYFKMKKT